MSDKKRGLGRGLAALLPAQEPAPEGVRSLPIGQLEPNRWQPRSRFDEAGLEALAASVRDQGMLQPIVVSPLESGKYAIVAGERRWRAAQRAGLERVPVMVRAVEGPRQSLELALIENLQRTDLDPIEEAEAYRALIDHFELAHDQIAARVGKSRAAVSNALRLLKLPASVQELLRAGRLTAGQARALLALGDDEAIERLAERAAREGLSARALEALATSPAKRRRARLPLEPNAAAAAERLTQRLQTRVEIDRRGRGGVLRIHFHSEEELMRIYDLIAGAARR